MPLPRYARQVQPTLTPVVPERPDPSAGVGLQAAGQALGQGAQVAGAIATDVYHRGVVSDVAKATAGFGAEAGDIYARLKALRGDDAIAAVEPARLALEQARKRWAEQLATDDAKGLFERQSQETSSKYGLGLTQHFLAATRESEEANAGAAAASAVNQAPLHYKDPEFLATLYTQAGALAFKLADTTAEGAARAQAIKQDVLEGAAKGALAAYDAGTDPDGLDTAKGLVYGNKPALGKKFPALAAAVESAGLVQMAEAEAMRIEADTSKAGGFTEDTADAEVEKIANVKLKDLVQTRVRDRLSERDRIQKDATQAVWKQALGAYNRGGLRAAESVRLPDGSSAMDWLNANAPDLEKRLRDDARSKWRQAKADASQSRAEIADARNKAKDDFLALPPETQATLDIDAEFGLETDATGLAALRRLQSEAVRRVKNGESITITDFVRDGEAQGVGVVGASGGKKTREAKQKEYHSALVEAYYQFEEDNKRKPTAADKQEIIDAFLKKEIREIPWAIDKEEFGFERRARLRAAGEVVPLPVGRAGKPIVKWQESASRGTRRPVYADGTTGPEEPL